MKQSLESKKEPNPPSQLTSRFLSAKSRILVWTGVVLVSTSAVLTVGCNPKEPPITYSITVPSKDTLRFEAQLSKRYGIGLTGSFDILQYGTVFVRGETPSSNFTFGFTLHGAVFLKDTWVSFQETTALPTGALFPSWVNTQVVNVTIPAANTEPVDFNFYFGTRGQLHVGLAATIKAINQSFPELFIDYAFYDSQGRVVLGLVFFGPSKDAAGNLIQPGGIFVGSNITPFLSADVIAGLPKNPPSSGSTTGPGVSSEPQAQLAQALELVRASELGQPLTLHGQSVTSEIRVHGKDSAHIRSGRDLRRAVGRFLETTR